MSKIIVKDAQGKVIATIEGTSVRIETSNGGSVEIDGEPHGVTNRRYGSSPEYTGPYGNGPSALDR